MAGPVASSTPLSWLSSPSSVGRSQGGLTSKMGLACDGPGRPLGFVVTGGSANDCTYFTTVMQDRSVGGHKRRAHPAACRRTMTALVPQPPQWEQHATKPIRSPYSASAEQKERDRTTQKSWCEGQSRRRDPSTGMRHRILAHHHGSDVACADAAAPFRDASKGGGDECGSGPPHKRRTL